MSKTALIATAATLAMTSGLASAQYDVSIAGTIVLQTVQSGTTALTAGKSTIIRAGLNSTGTLPSGQGIDGIMRVFVGGVEIAGSPIYSSNGPLIPPATANPANLDDSLNFYFIPPTSTNVEFKIEVNPAGPNQVTETDYTNNSSTSGTLTFDCHNNPEVIYVPIDYRPSGGSTPNLPNPTLIEPGNGDNFIQGIYPGADWEYRPYDQPSKLWTSSLSGSGSGLLSSLASEMQLMNPKPDFMYGWIPGSLPYNGQANGAPGIVGIGNTQTIRHQRTFAHELGHLFGKNHNTQTIGTVGVDVEHHLAITESLPEIKPPSKMDIMAAGLLTHQAWVWPTNYNFFLNHSIYKCPPIADKAVGAKPGMYFGGIFDPTTGSFTLGDSLSIDDVREIPSIPIAQADLILIALGKGGPVDQLARIGISAHTESCSGDPADLASLAAPFSATLPANVNPRDVMTIVITDRNGTVMARMDRSPSAPTVEFTSPRPTELIPQSFTLEWRTADADGDAVKQYLRYSPDGTRLMPLALEIQGNSFTVDMTELPRLITGKGFFELVASDGLNTTVVRTALLRPTLQLATAAGANPTTFILTPDSGKVFPKASTVLLHSSGWDLEDRGLTGSSVIWSSDLDGQIASGRVTSTTALSVGNHTITVTVTDSDGNIATDTSAITITDRSLPGVLTTCQTDIGFGGPGSSILMVCGGDLSTGTTADLTLTGAAPSQPLWIAESSTSNPTPIFGGMIIPIPLGFILPGSTDASGSYTLAGFPGGGGPATIYVQALYLDPSQALGFGISNALLVDFLP